ncbi:MAG: hypothetical protein PWP34_1881, partial [Desulfuromonadales bacterium]|nr:hypothetical protein [Desulfuromonadales bacterium]
MQAPFFRFFLEAIQVITGGSLRVVTGIRCGRDTENRNSFFSGSKFPRLSQVGVPVQNQFGTLPREYFGKPGRIGQSFAPCDAADCRGMVK